MSKPTKPDAHDALQPSTPIAASGWQATTAGNALLTLTTVASGKLAALRMDYDFKGGGGFVVARRAVPRAMPQEYAVTCRLRARGARNDLELKLIDASGQNVWRWVKRDLEPPRRWQRLRISSREIEFAWGPSDRGGIDRLGWLEIAVVARAGGAGTLWLADLALMDCSPTALPVATASSARPDGDAAAALTGAGWRPRAEDARPWITVDSGQRRTLGGLVIDWLEQAPAAGFRVRASNDGRRWKTLHSAASAGGRRTTVALPGVANRYLRLEIHGPTAGAALRLESFEFSRTPDVFWYHVAAAEARGWHPRWLHREQTLWTPTGTANGTECALMNADGMVEVGEGTFCIEPMLWIGQTLMTWADVRCRQELLQQWMPVPTAVWEGAGWRLRTQADATPGGVVRIRCRLENLGEQALAARLFLVVRPFQVTPPWQHFRQVGGLAPIHDLVWRDGAVWVNENRRIIPLPAPAGFGALCFDEGLIAAPLAAGRLPAGTAAHDAQGFAAGALAFDLTVAPGESGVAGVRCPPPPGATPRAVGGAAPPARASDADGDRNAEFAFDWGAAVPLHPWTASGWLAEAIRAAATATAHVLVTRSGAALQPGPRRYTRSWIRDGAMMSAALLRMGHAAEVLEFIRWYAPHQRADGFVPCCVDRDGVDWLVEHDSHGELLALIADHRRFAPAAARAGEFWEVVERAVGCIAALVDAEGLMPPSVSHEGYLAQPVHSYWDDFWTLRGLQDAVELALAHGRADCATRWQALRERFAASLFDSIEATRARRGLDFIPGSIEWADFDPTATANALYLLDVPAGLNRAALERTFDIYLAEWRGKRSGAVPSPNYTPYEIRIIGALVRLGRRDAALELLQFFLQVRCPTAWNQWPEIVWRDQTAPAHLGDLPHTWIGAEYVLAVRCLFAYERDADDSLVLAAGLPADSLDGAGVQVKAMPTAHGPLSYSLRRLDPGSLECVLAAGMPVTVHLRPPLRGPLRGVLVDGLPCTTFDADSVTLPPAPAPAPAALTPAPALPAPASAPAVVILLSS